MFLALAVGLALLPGRVEAGDATMDYIEYQMSGTGISGADAEKVHRVWRSGSTMARIEEEAGAGEGRVINIAHEPYEYVIAEHLKRGERFTNPDPAGRVGLPLFPSARSKSLKMLEIGRELEFFHDHGARRVDSKAAGSSTAVYELPIREVLLRLTIDLAARAPSALVVTIPQGTLTVTYRRYERRRPLDPALFEPPAGIAWATTAPAASGDSPFDGDADPWPSLEGLTPMGNTAACAHVPTVVYYLLPGAADVPKTAANALRFWQRYPQLHGCFALARAITPGPLTREDSDKMRGFDALLARLAPDSGLPRLGFVGEYADERSLSQESGVLMLIDRHGGLKAFDTKTQPGREAADKALADAVSQDELVSIDTAAESAQRRSNAAWFAAPRFEKVKRFLEKKDWDHLDWTFMEMRDHNARSSYGAWELASAYETFTRDTGQSPRFVEARLAALNEWLAARPDSVAARVALAYVWFGYAQAVRRGRAADQMSAAEIARLTERVAKARAILDEAERLPVKDPAIPTKGPEVYRMLLRIAKEEGRPHSEIDLVFRKGQRLWPDYQYLYEEVAVDYLPKWGGAPGELEAFLKRTVKEDVGGLGAETYARVLMLLRDQGEFGLLGAHIFKNSGLSWPYAKSGLQDICRRFPHPLNFNNLAFFAAAAGDKAAAVAAFDKLGGDYSAAIWGNRATFELARRWAYGRSYTAAARTPAKPVARVAP